MWVSGGGGGSVSPFEQTISLAAYGAAGDSVEISPDKDASPVVIEVAKVVGATLVESKGTVKLTYDTGADGAFTVENLLNATTEYHISVL